MSDQSNSSGTMMIGLILGLLFLLLGIGFMRTALAPALLPVGNVLANVSGWMPGLDDEAARVRAMYADRVNSRKAMRASTDRALAYLGDTGKLLLPWMVLTSVCLAVWIVRRSPRARYSRRLNLDQLIEMQSTVFPRIRPALFLSGRMKPDQRGPFTTLLSPYEWSVKHGVFTVDDPKATWRADRARAGFARQLSVEVHEHHRWLIGALGLIALQDVKGGDGLLDRLALAFDADPINGGWSYRLQKALGIWSWAKPVPGPLRFKMVLSGQTNRLLEAAHAKVIASPLWASITDAHAHIETRLCVLLEAAQKRTIVPPSAFLWLKALDRNLWYALHAVGMQPASTEAAGVRAHLRAERAAKRALPEPAVQAAVDALYSELEVDSWRAPKGVDVADVQWTDSGTPAPAV